MGQGFHTDTQEKGEVTVKLKVGGTGGLKANSQVIDRLEEERPADGEFY